MGDDNLGLYLCSRLFCMNHHNAIKSLIWIWMVALFGATVGVSVQQVYCYCVGKTTVSFFVAEDACHAEDILSLDLRTARGCCAKKTAPSKPACCQKPEPSQKGCTKKTTQVFQLKTAFEVGNPILKKVDQPKFTAEAAHFPSIEHLSSVAHSHCFFRFERPPPPISGRMICVRHGVFRC